MADTKLSHVEVTWRDACLRSVAVPLSQWSDQARFSVRRTVGFLVHDCSAPDATRECTACAKPRIVLAMTCDPPDAEGEEPQLDDVYNIPRAWVIKVRYLSRKSKVPAKVKAATSA